MLSRLNVLLLCGLFLLTGATACLAQQQGDSASGDTLPPDPNKRLATFQHGVNLSHWYGQSFEGYGEDHLSSYFTDDDARLIKQMGFDHVRLTVDEQIPFTDEPGELNVERLDKFDERVQMLLDAGLNVIVDLHPSDEFKEALHDDEKLEALATNWGAWAERLSEFDPERVMLEIMNEPSRTWPTAEWVVAQARVLNAMRTGAPQHTILVTSGNWSQAELLVQIRPYSDRNVVYTLHWYEPHLFTHQSAEWAGEACMGIAGLAFPVKPDNAASVTDKTTQSGSQSAKDLQWQIEQGWLTMGHLEKQLDAVVEWQRRHNVPVYVGEFGVYKKAAPEADRYEWYRVFREAFEARGWGWATWDYAGGFAMTDNTERGQRTPDEKMREALGLISADQ